MIFQYQICWRRGSVYFIELKNWINPVNNEYLEGSRESLLSPRIVLHRANGNFDWLIPGYQCIHAGIEAISALSAQDKSFAFIHPVNLP